MEIGINDAVKCSRRSPKAVHAIYYHSLILSKICDFSRQWKGRIPDLSELSKELASVE